MKAIKTTGAIEAMKAIKTTGAIETIKAAGAIEAIKKLSGLINVGLALIVIINQLARPKISNIQLLKFIFEIIHFLQPPFIK